MKAMQLAKPGGLDNLKLADIDDAAPPARGEITVRIRANSLNFHDYAVVAGFIPADDGRIPMADGAGEVEAVGEGVEEFAVGDHVVSCFFPTWPDGAPAIGDFSQTPGDGLDGYARERVTVPATWFTRAPESYSHAEAATLTTAGLTAWRALVVDGGLRAGESVLVLGTGGVSIFALQLARAMGATVIATSSSDEKLGGVPHADVPRLAAVHRHSRCGAVGTGCGSGRDRRFQVKPANPGSSAGAKFQIFVII
jgi:NADPH:quinone reductase-like Zn-dependent oxidoreductase